MRPLDRFRAWGTTGDQLQPRLSRLTMVAMTFAILNTWIALAGTMGLAIPPGGSAAFLCGFVFCVLCNFAVVASLGELAAIWPTAGGQYRFVYALCTEKWKRIRSFLVGWINIDGWLTLSSTQFISAASVIASDGRNEVEAKILGRWNGVALYWSILSVVIISIVLLSMSSKTNAIYVFTNVNNETGWSDGIAWIFGLLQAALSLIGFDAMPNPARDALRAMLCSIGVGGITGTVFIVVILFCLADPSTVMPTSSSRAAATIMTLMLAICFIKGTNACTTSASRLIFSMARDKGFVFYNYFSHIHPTLNVPVRAVLLSFVFNLIFGLLYLGPAVAFNAFIFSCTIFLNVSYALPVILLITVETPFKLGERRGAFINWIAVICVAITTVGNYVSAVIGIFTILVITCWVICRKTFEGPEFDVIMGLQNAPTGNKRSPHPGQDEKIGAAA
ncbi:hypothetical protein B0T10DRAFT_525093 [Thelonectria olida]|uniref:Choline transport protein n=1 Tax=Thelonectria olida TaxID=1576542 RepID=A0A9P9AZF0_9HYPO|nr:hypothetical protein B0T10DRAFT_525093 [Thelonectria olida]